MTHRSNLAVLAEDISQDARNIGSSHGSSREAGSSGGASNISRKDANTRCPDVQDGWQVVIRIESYLA